MRLCDRYEYNPDNKTFPLIYRKDSGYFGRAGYKCSNHGRSARLKFFGKAIAMSRAVWEYFNGKIPKNMHVDHIDGDNSNNLIENLQLLSNSKNKQKGAPRNYRNNVSGMTGVLWDSKLSKWKVSFRWEKTLYYFGVFESLTEAKKVCQEQRQKICIGSTRPAAVDASKGLVQKWVNEGKEV